MSDPSPGFQRDDRTAEWARAREEVRRILVDEARAERTITYARLAERLSALRLTPDAPDLAMLLREVSTAEHAAGRGLLSALVVRRQGRRRPGAGFFRLARELGRDVSDPEAFWQAECERVIEDWRGCRG